MNESFIYNTEEKILTYEISDAALEIAAGFTNDMTVSLTIAYCTFDFCNAIGPKRRRKRKYSSVSAPT
jgi:hypothetical protein